MSDHPAPHPLSAADRGALWFLLIIGAVLAVLMLVISTIRLSAVITGESIEVVANLSPEGSRILAEQSPDRGATIETVTFTVTHFASPALYAAIAQPALLIVVTLGIAAALGVLARNMLRGHVFRKTNTAAIVTAWAFAGVGTVIQPVLEFAVALGALEQLGYDAARMLSIEISPAPFVAAVILIAITAHAFSVGTKIQRETEGLV